MLVPENHTRNLHYLQNVATLKRILEGAGLTVRIGSLIPDLKEPMEVETSDGEKLTLEPIAAHAATASALEGFDPCAVLLNNDLSAGIPAILRGIEQPVRAAARGRLGHAPQVAPLPRLRPRGRGLRAAWSASTRGSINPAFSQCGKVNFAEKEGEECLAANVEFVLGEIREKYAQYGITEQPFVIVKADAGTYGMGIMTVKSVDEVRNLNRKTRNKMATIKEGQPVHEVIIQEGVYTFENVRRRGGRAGGLHDRPVRGRRLLPRAHRARHRREPELAGRASSCRSPSRPTATRPTAAASPGDPPNRFYTYGVVARLAMLAAARRGRGARRARRARWRSGRRTHEARVRRRSARRTSRPTRIRRIAMMREAARRGHEVHALEARDDVRARRRGARARAAARGLTTTTTRWYRAPASRRGARSRDFDGVLMRKDPPFDQEYYYATLLLERAEAEGARVVNGPRALRDWNEKLAILRFPQFTPPTLVASDMARVHAFIDEHARRDREEARRHGRHDDLPRARRRPEPQRDRRDDHRHGRAHDHGAALHPARSRRATSACW